MIKLFSPKHAERILRSLDDEILHICRMCHLPPPALRAILYKEITDMDLLDPLADASVAFNQRRAQLLHHLSDLKRGGKNSGFFQKYDSSTGYGQIFARTAILAIRFAVERSILPADFILRGRTCLPSPDSLSDIVETWHRLHDDSSFNLLCSALNLIFCAWEMTGKVDFASYTPEEFRLIFTRYNADVRHITPYGEITYGYYLQFLSKFPATP